MRLQNFLFVIILFVTASCAAEAVDRLKQSDCGIKTTAPTQDRLLMVVEAAEAARTREIRCGRASREPICRALWLARQLDPVVVSSEAPQLGHRSAVIVRWALGVASATAEPVLRAVLEERRRLDGELATALDELDRPEIAELIVARAEQAILAPLASAEAQCR
jgi:hypothetical protein